MSRLAFIFGGLMLLVPAEAFEKAIYIELAGLAVSALAVGREMAASRKSA